ncbi:hypothetical protein N7486_009378 [Penicillium sp. IBT 16267x]|nr:hypothetical protein N7486_010073 [Penicillium sp. IBT 16267x]KAJ6090563.1 hypothetical protein N7486_009378 [Penicillium sp. IBT 16267x]
MMKSDRTTIHDRPARLLSIDERIARIESLVTTYPVDVEVPSKEISSSLNTLTSFIEEQARLDEKGSLHLLKDGETEFIGLSSGLTILSPAGLEWLSARIGPSRMEQLMTVLKFVRSSPSLSLGHFSGTAASQPRQKLPPKRLAIIYVNAFFERLHSWLPFIQRSTFDLYFEPHYSDTPPSSSWYAMLNAVICLGYTSMKQASILTEDETNAALGYLNNAMSVVPDLIFLPVDTLGVQALLLMAIIQNSNMSFQASSMLMSIAVRLGLAKGFHQKPAGGSANTESSLARANIFWVAYVMDKGMCIRLGHPPLIDDDEIGIGLPSKQTESGEPSFLRHMVELSLIQINNPRRPEAHSNLAYLQLFARTVHTSPLTEKLPIGKGFSALADLLASITASVITSSHEILTTEEFNIAGDPSASDGGGMPMPQMPGEGYTTALPFDQGSGDDQLPLLETASTVFDFLFQSLSPFDLEM